jgi:hypothetical protein
MPGLSKVIVLDPDARAGRQVQLGFEREGVPSEVIPAEPARLAFCAADTGLVMVGGADAVALDLIVRARATLDDARIDAPLVFAGRGLRPGEALAAGADESVVHPAYLRDVVTIGRLLRGKPSGQRAHLVGTLVQLTGVYGLVRALATMGRSATLTLFRGLRRGEIRFYRGEVTSAQVGLIHGQAALHQLLLWTEARFDYHHEDIVRRQQIPLSHDDLFADAERFLAAMREASGGLSPSMTLEQDLPRVQSFGRQIPTEVYGVLRMFDGYRVLADVLEDSAYRVFEILRVTQRAVEIGLLRVVQPAQPRATWRPIVGIEDWLLGHEPRDLAADVAAIPGAIEGGAARESGPASARDARPRGTNKSRRNKKKRRSETPVAVPHPIAPAIDWGALVPRAIGAEVGPLAGVVPAAQVSGEIARAMPDRTHEAPVPHPTVMLDEAAAQPDPTAAAEAAAAAEPAAAEAEERARAIRVAAATVSLSDDTARVIEPGGAADTAQERAVDSATPSLDSGATVDDTPTTRTIAAGGPPIDVSGATTAPVVARSLAELEIPETAREPAPTGDAIGDPPPIAAASELTVPAASELTVPAASERTVPAAIELTVPAASELTVPPPRTAAMDAMPSVVIDEPSDGVIRQHITSARTAPVARQHAPSEPPQDDRPEDATGEITSRRAAAAQPQASEPSILVADVAAVHVAASAIAGSLAGRPRPGDAASAQREAPAIAVRTDAVTFTELDEAFFRAGHDHHDLATAPTMTESFDDLDEGYRPAGFWDRLLGRPRRTPGTK